MVHLRLLTGLRKVDHGPFRLLVILTARSPADALPKLRDGQKKDILLIGEERFGPPQEEIATRLNAVTDLGRLERMIRRAAKASDWREVLDTE